MSFPLDNIQLGPATYGKRGTIGQCDGIIWHTTEGSGVSEVAARATATWQTSTQYGSYNFIIFDGGILLTVPYLEASGGVNTGGATWAPNRYQYLKKYLPSRAYADPNGWLLNVSFSGKTGEFKKGNIPDNMIDTAARLVLWVQEQDWSSPVLVQSGHMHWQTDRSDPSEYVLKRIADRVTELSKVVSVDNPFSDIEGNVHKSAIIRTAEFGLWATIKGKQIPFNPKDALTRAEAATLVDRILSKTGGYK